MPRLPLSPTAVWGVVRELRGAVQDLRPLVLAGASGPVRALEEALGAGGDPDALRALAGRRPSVYDLEGAGVLVHVIEGTVTAEDEETLRLAERKDVEVVCVVVGAHDGEVPSVPYVLDTEIVAARPGEELPVDVIAARVAERAGDDGHLLAARLPALREPVVDEIVRRFSMQNGVLGVAIFVPGADFPVLTLNQVRMVLRIAAAHGHEIDRERALEVLSVVAAALGFRSAARQLAGFVPGVGWAVKGGVAYAGTRAVGEAAAAYFDAGGPALLAGSVRSRT